MMEILNREELEAMRVAELQELAVVYAIELPRKARKATIIDLLLREGGVEEEEEEEVAVPSGPTFVREGPMSGEYYFAEIHGSVAARSVEEAYEKARELMLKNPGVLR